MTNPQDIQKETKTGRKGGRLLDFINTYLSPGFNCRFWKTSLVQGTLIVMLQYHTASNTIITPSV